MKRRSERYFPSQRDLWFGLVIWLSLLLSVGVAISDHRWPELAVLVPVILFFAWCWCDTGYTIAERELRVKCGPLREKIPFDRIRSVRRRRTIICSPALSLDRLQIRHGQGFIGFTLISPVNAAAFLEELKKRCPEADFPGL